MGHVDPWQPCIKLVSKLVLRFAYLLKFYFSKQKLKIKKKSFHLRSMKIWGQIFYFKRRRMMQNQGATSKAAIKVPKRYV